MGVETLARLLPEALYLVLWLSAPVLLAALAVGLLAGLASAVTRVADPSLTFVPRLVGAALALVASGGWMLARLVDFTDQLWRAIPLVVAG